MTELDVLQRARTHIADGWVQGDYIYRRPGNKLEFCIIAAVEYARGQVLTFADGCTIVNRAVKEPKVTLTVPGQWDNIPGQWDNIVEYNDAYGRSQKDVLAVIDARIAELEGTIHGR